MRDLDGWMRVPTGESSYYIFDFVRATRLHSRRSMCGADTSHVNFCLDQTCYYYISISISTIYKGTNIF
jgi:hypothetical protein